ncbi:MAG: hypothetical protein ACR2M7_00800 [Bdellovibrionales bacterium]
MFKSIFILTLLIFNGFAYAESYVPKFKVIKQAETRYELQKNLVEDLNFIKTIFNDSDSVASIKEINSNKESFDNTASL